MVPEKTRVMRKLRYASLYCILYTYLSIDNNKNAMFSTNEPGTIIPPPPHSTNNGMKLFLEEYFYIFINMWSSLYGKSVLYLRELIQVGLFRLPVGCWIVDTLKRNFPFILWKFSKPILLHNIKDTYHREPVWVSSTSFFLA